MQARRRATIILSVLIAALFVAHWRVADYLTNPNTWPYRPPVNQGQTFFGAVFSGGAGTPAVLAMLGGQRTMVANILWDYSDYQFHKQKPREMARTLEAVVTLNPTFLKAWSTYGWHVAWNLYIYTDNPTLRQKYLREGEAVYMRALKANPDKTNPYFDVFWLLTQRKGDYKAAQPYLEAVVYNKPLEGVPRKQDFQPMLPGENLSDAEQEMRWDPELFGRRLAFLYLKRGVISYGTYQYYEKRAQEEPARAAEFHARAAKVKPMIKEFLQKSIDCYRDKVMQLVPSDDYAPKKIDEITRNMDNPQWLQDEYNQEVVHNRAFGLPYPLEEVDGTSEFVDWSTVKMDTPATTPEVNSPESERRGGSVRR